MKSTPEYNTSAAISSNATLKRCLLTREIKCLRKSIINREQLQLQRRYPRWYAIHSRRFLWQESPCTVTRFFRETVTLTFQFRQPFPSVIIPPPGEDNSTNSRKAILNPAYPFPFHPLVRKLSSESLPLVSSSRLFRPPSSTAVSPSLANLLSSVKPPIRDCWP